MPEMAGGKIIPDQVEQASKNNGRKNNRPVLFKVNFFVKTEGKGSGKDKKIEEKIFSFHNGGLQRLKGLVNNPSPPGKGVCSLLEIQ